MREQIKAIKRSLEKAEGLLERMDGQDGAEVKEAFKELKDSWEKLGEFLKEQVQEQERENERAYEEKKDKIRDLDDAVSEF